MDALAKRRPAASYERDRQRTLISLHVPGLIAMPNDTNGGRKFTPI